MGFVVIAFSVDIFITSLCIWLATKFSFVSIEPERIAVIVVAVAVVSLAPVVGWIAGLALFVYLLIQMSSCSLADAIWVVIFTKMISFIVVVFVSSII